MSLRDVYEALLIEMNKVDAPNILLEDFNYFLRKAINQYVNKRYNLYETNQQTTDDLSYLKDTLIVNTNDLKQVDYKLSKIHNGTYKFKFPNNYFHILNCVCTFKAKKKYRCYNKDSIFEIGATKLTADQWNNVTNNFWNKPTYRRPYYYIHHIGDLTINEERDSIKTNERYGNYQDVVCEIRIGTDSQSVFDLVQITIDYLKVPKFYELTQDHLDTIEDSSEMLEFPDYICQEIINELVHIVMENISDQRIQTHPVVSQSIAAQQQAPQQ